MVRQFHACGINKFVCVHRVIVVVSRFRCTTHGTIGVLSSGPVKASGYEK